VKSVILFKHLQIILLFLFVILAKKKKCDIYFVLFCNKFGMPPKCFHWFNSSPVKEKNCFLPLESSFMWTPWWRDFCM